MTRARDVDQLVGGIRKLAEALIAADQRKIDVHQTVTMAEADLRDTLKRVLLGMKIEESAEP
jgi:hypothetical protein